MFSAIHTKAKSHEAEDSKEAGSDSGAGRAVLVSGVWGGEPGRPGRTIGHLQCPKPARIRSL